MTLPPAETEQPDDFAPRHARRALVAVACITAAFCCAVGVLVAGWLG